MSRLRVAGSPSERLEWLLERNENGCLVWTGHVNSTGHGQMGVDGKATLVHRLAWSLARGPIPEGLFVIHRCFNPRCCEPEHLFLGSAAEMVAHNVAGGRTRRPGGEAVHSAKLTWAKVRRARALIAKGVQYRYIALMLGVGKSCIGKLALGQTWREEPTASGDGRPL